MNAQINAIANERKKQWNKRQKLIRKIYQIPRFLSQLVKKKSVSFLKSKRPNRKDITLKFRRSDQTILIRQKLESSVRLLTIR